MTDPITEVPVLVSDLVALKDMISTAYYKSVAEDMIDAYKKLNQRVTHSAFTKALEAQMNKVDTYIEQAREEEDDE